MNPNTLYEIYQQDKEKKKKEHEFIITSMKIDDSIPQVEKNIKAMNPDRIKKLRKKKIKRIRRN